MKVEKFESRGVNVARIESRCQTDGDGVYEIIKEAEDRFFGKARQYANERAEAVGKTSAAYRRRARCEKITLSSNVSDLGDVLRIELYAVSGTGADAKSATYAFYYDKSEQILIKRPRSKKNKEIKSEKPHKEPSVRK